jgi:hypothetical protein
MRGDQRQIVLALAPGHFVHADHEQVVQSVRVQDVTEHPGDDPPDGGPVEAQQPGQRGLVHRGGQPADQGLEVAGDPASDHPASDHPASDHPASDHPASDHPASDRPATDRPAALLMRRALAGAGPGLPLIAPARARRGSGVQGGPKGRRTATRSALDLLTEHQGCPPR